MKPIYVFGHKNPDTDSVCSAISLAYLKNITDKGNFVPKVIGPINRGTKFVLDFFKVPAPSYLNDVKVQIKDLKLLQKVYVHEEDSIEDAFRVMEDHNLTAIPIVNDNKKLTGYVTLKNIGKYLMEGQREEINTNLKHLLKTVNGKIITNFKNEFKGNAKIVAFGSENFINNVKLTENDILVVGDRYKILEYAINSKVQLIILSGDNVIPVKLLNKAVKNKVNIITSKYLSYELCNKLSFANFVYMINDTSTPITININSYYTDFVSLTKKYNYTNYPVVKNDNTCVGIIKVTNSFKYEKKKVILVDHNNYEQSVEGINESEILEVFDHHNIGNIGTNSPIYFTSRPVGCTATIIYEQFKKNKVVPPKSIAGLLLSAIISDTLLFTSPTSTLDDEKAAKELGKIAKVEVDKYGFIMLKEASSIKGLSVDQLIHQDFKSYSINNKTYGIAVITTMDFEEISRDMDKYVDRIDEMSENTYEAVLLFITDIIKGGSYIIYNNKSKTLVANAFNIKNLNEGHFVKGLISRKKQIIPAIMNELER